MAEVVSANINYIPPPAADEAWLRHYVPGSVKAIKIEVKSHRVPITNIRSVPGGEDQFLYFRYYLEYNVFHSTTK
jgi:hypothetical protein